MEIIFDLSYNPDNSKMLLEVGAASSSNDRGIHKDILVPLRGHTDSHLLFCRTAHVSAVPSSLDPENVAMAVLFRSSSISHAQHPY